MNADHSLYKHFASKDNESVLVLDWAIQRKQAYENPVSFEQYIKQEKEVTTAVVAGTVALWLAQGAVNWVGGKIMDSIFGGQSDSLQIDLNRLVKEILDGVARTVDNIVEQRLLDAAHRQALVELSALQISFSAYMESGGQDRLEHATNSAVHVIAELESLGLRASQAYLIAYGIYFAILQERIKTFGERERRHLKSAVTQSINGARRIRNTWENWHAARFSMENRELLRIGTVPQYSCQLVIDGKPYLAWVVDALLNGKTGFPSFYIEDTDTFHDPECPPSPSPRIVHETCENLSEDEKNCIRKRGMWSFHEALRKEHLEPNLKVVAKWEQLRDEL